MRKSLGLLLFLIMGSFIFFIRFSEDKTISDQSIRIGIADDMSGFVINFIIEKQMLLPDKELKPFFIRDCWAKTSQWALSTEVYPMAILCKEAAKSLVENNSNLEIIGPLFRNTDVIVKKSEQIEKIAIQQSKLFHEEYLQAEYPQA